MRLWQNEYTSSSSVELHVLFGEHDWQQSSKLMVLVFFVIEVRAAKCHALTMRLIQLTLPAHRQTRESSTASYSAHQEKSKKYTQIYYIQLSHLVVPLAAAQCRSFSSCTIHTHARERESQ